MSTNYEDKVSSLLAKAEHASTSQEEAEAFTAKALELMAKHGIDEARDRSTQTRDQVEMRTVTISNPLARIKALMLNNTAPTLGVQMVMGATSRGSFAGQAHLFGFSSDIDRVQTMQASLMAQMTGILAQTPIPTGESPKRYKNAWRIAFISQVAKRLQQAQQEATSQERAATGTDLILRDRARAVQDKRRQEFPRTTKRSAGSSSSAHGSRAGYDAGGRAELGSRRSNGTRRQIGS